VDEPTNPLALAIVSGATWVAREYASNIAKLSELMIEAVEHRGFSLLDILQPCETFNKSLTHLYYQENTYQLGEDPPSAKATGGKYNPGDKIEALKKAWEWPASAESFGEARGEKKIALGVIYKEEKLSFEEKMVAIREKALVELPVGKRDVAEEMGKLR
jgi:2-oxoglutarate ferredoxin oxidoreductase subunit beta